MHFPDADGEKVFAPQGTNNTNYNLNLGSNVVVRTSSYAKFAAKKLPMGKCDIIGIASCYNSDWQIEIRKVEDIIEK